MPRPGQRLDLVSLDLDGTLIHPAIFNAVADRLGFGAPLQKSYQAYLEGTLSLENAFWQDFEHFRGRKVADCWKALEATTAWTPGIRAAIDQLHAEGIEVVLTTDQPRFLAEFTGRFGVDHFVCSDSVTEDGVVRDVRPAFAKWPNLRAFLKTEGLPPSRVAHVGNGTNDIPVFQEVGYALAVNALAPEVARAARAAIPRVADFREVSEHLLSVV